MLKIIVVARQCPPNQVIVDIAGLLEVHKSKMIAKKLYYLSKTTEQLFLCLSEFYI